MISELERMLFFSDVNKDRTKTFVVLVEVQVTERVIIMLLLETKKSIKSQTIL